MIRPGQRPCRRRDVRASSQTMSDDDKNAVYDPSSGVIIESKP